MSDFNSNDRELLLKLARSVIAKKLSGGDISLPDNISPALKEKRGCFVTLHKKGMLRGCIGTIEPVQPLIECVAENAINAAFKDPRFPPLDKSEFPLTDIEISVLTVPEKLEYKDGDDLVSKLKPGVHGVILSKGWHRSTFLPQVWDQLPAPEIFLVHLCQKGGMPSDCWKDGSVTVEVYEAEYFSE